MNPTKTAVLFYMETNDGDNTEYTPLAYFPEMEHDHHSKTCYSHTGQHSACHPDYIKGLQLATPDQYKPLVNELKAIGYNLNILNP
jgi:hypothetical protein